MPNIPVVETILNVNDQLADKNRQTFDEAGVLALNVMASPGGGKTSVIAKTIDALREETRIGVISSRSISKGSLSKAFPSR